MELRQLRYFLTILRLGSINQAAAVLNVTQPSLSHSIKALERSVGAELIIRGGGGVRASVVGEEFAKYANNIVREAEKAKAVVDAWRGVGEGRIALGVLSVFADHIVPSILSDFFAASQNPDVDVFVYTTSFAEVVKRIIRAEWDLVMTLAPDPESFPPEIGWKHLGHVKSSVYCAASHPLAGKTNVTREDMAAYRWIASNLGMTEHLLESSFGEESLKPKICLRTDSMTLIPAMLTASPFLCMAPDLAVTHKVASGELVRVDQHVIASESALVVLYSNLSDRTAPMRSLMSIIGTHLRALGVTE